MNTGLVFSKDTMSCSLQVVDVLWSDPMAQEGCKANTVRGGGCYFGPNVTKQLLQKYNLQFLIRSHECKPEGYEFCHGRKVGGPCAVSQSAPHHSSQAWMGPPSFHQSTVPCIWYPFTQSN